MMIAVIGGNNASPESIPIAEQVGALIARAGHIVVCGGRGGVMEAVCRGARAEGGHTIGILPGPHAADANDYVEFPIVSNMGFARNVIVVLSGSAVIAIDGSYGTLSEIGLARNHGRPVIGLGTWRVIDGLDKEDTSILRAGSPAEAVDLAISEGLRALDRRQQGVSS